ncbi:MAG: hypothetical protein HZB18_03410 [Chloroflexi bacterium]|nr:hypothetical protein [Chloroflexota bacterium]
MWNDEIVEEIRKHREAYASKFNFDLQAMYEDLKKAEKKSKHKKVSFKPKKTIRVEIKEKSITR